MAEFRFSCTLTQIDPAALSDFAGVSHTVNQFRDATASIAVAQMGTSPELARLAAQRRVSSRWTVKVSDLTGSIGATASVDVRLLDLPDSLVGADVATLSEFVSDMIAGVVAYAGGDAGTAVAELADGHFRFDDEFLSSVSVAQG